MALRWPIEPGHVLISMSYPENDFSCGILHRHFELSPDERNIEEPDGRASASKNLDNIYPCSWLYYEGKLVPYEFRHSPGVNPKDLGLPTLPPQFVTDLGHLLQDRDLCDIIGIQLYTNGTVGMEGTDHAERFSTTEDHDEKTYVPPHNANRASFAFFRC